MAIHAIRSATISGGSAFRGVGLAGLARDVRRPMQQMQRLEDAAAVFRSHPELRAPDNGAQADPRAHERSTNADSITSKRTPAFVNRRVESSCVSQLTWPFRPFARQPM